MNRPFHSWIIMPRKRLYFQLSFSSLALIKRLTWLVKRCDFPSWMSSCSIRGRIATPFLMESSAHLKKSGGLQLGSLVRKLSVMMDLTMRSRDSKKRDATWRVFSCLLTPLKWEKRWSKQLQFHHLSSHWPWSESKIRWKDELTQLWS